MSAFVEYFLQAELKTSSRGSADVVDATLPLKMLYVDLEPLVMERCSRISRHPRDVSYHNLIVRQMNTEAAQKRQALTESSTDLILVFDIQVQIPTVLLINSPDPVPFYVLAVPDLTKSCNAVQFSSQKICITHISIRIVASTEVKCTARKTTRQAKNETQIDLHAEDAYRQYGDALFIPWQAPIGEEQASQRSLGDSVRESPEPLNVGEKIGLHLVPRQDLYASFQTYNIKHKHYFKWEMTVQIDGKNFGLLGQDIVKISTSPELERSTEWIRPPLGDQPPSYSDYHDDMVESEAGRSSQDRWDKFIKLYAEITPTKRCQVKLINAVQMTYTFSQKQTKLFQLINYSYIQLDYTYSVQSALKYNK
ncbi:hypothetical protein LTS17_012791 [Exophiala oligosperma]